MEKKWTFSANALKMLSNKRNFFLKSILFAVVIYLCIHLFSYSGVNFSRELQQVQAGRNLAALDAQSLLAAVQQNHQEDERAQQPADAPAVANSEMPMAAMKSNVVPPPTSSPAPPPTVAERVKQITQCLDRTMVPRTQQRGDYWVLYNYIRAQSRYKCEDTITYTTHADYSFLDNLVPLLERWQGPISIAIHAPGSDFQNTLESISYLRDCVSPLVKQFVTFHIYFSTKHVPKQV